MPRRLLSIRGRNGDKANNNEAIIQSPEYFDFDFRQGPSVLARTSPTEDNRPFSSGTAEPRHKRQRTTSKSRPQSSNGLKTAVDKRMQLTRGENGWIGVAFGSPTHPPSGWAEDPSPVSPVHAFRFEGPFPSATPSSKWKKIGGYFKAKATPLKQITPPLVSTGFNHEQNKLGLPIHRTPWRNPKSPPVNPPADFGSTDTIRTPEFDVVSAHHEASTEPLLSKSFDLPLLEIDIPSTELDRYSVMFQKIGGSSASSISSGNHEAAIEVKTLSLQVKKEAELPALPPPSPRRLNTPTFSGTPYSLFPVPTRPRSRPFIHSGMHSDTSLSTRPRSISSPAAMLSTHVQVTDSQVEKIKSETLMSTHDNAITVTPVQTICIECATEDLPTNKNVGESFVTTSDQAQQQIIEALDKYDPVHQSQAETLLITSSQEIDSGLEVIAEGVACSPKPRSSACDDIATSPEDSVALSERDDIPWMSTDSLQSSASSHTTVDDDIFFDVRSFRGSKGVIDSQFIISRPDSAAVQLLRSASKKTKTRHMGPDFLDADHYDKGDPFCMPPDLQAAEHYCSSSDIYETEHSLRLSMFDRAIAEVEKLASPSRALATCSVDVTRTATTAQKASRIRNNTVNRSLGLTIGIPSPIAERSEEVTPNSASGAAFLPRVRHIATQASLERPGSVQSITPSTSGIPPPVPEKDLKFLPVSKYAVQYDVTQPSGKDARLRLQQTSRSATDRCKNQKIAPSRTRTPERSSVPHTLGDSHERTQASSKRSPQQALAVDQCVVAVTVRPAAEVSIARTVSLSRKTSQQVLVSRAPSRRDHRSCGRSNSGDSSNTAAAADEAEKLHLSENRAMSPIVMEAYKGHRPGSSMSLVVENI